MSDFIRRMLNGTVLMRAAEDGTGSDASAADPAADQNAGGATEAAASAPVASAPSEDGVSQGTADAVEAPPAATPVPDRAQQRMNQLVAERWAERRRAQEAESRAAVLQEQLNQPRASLQPQVDANGQPVAPVPRTPQAAQPDLQRLVAEQTAQNEFNRSVASEVEKGRTSHKDFDTVASNLQRFGELPRTFVEAALATGKGADVMYHLGSDIAEADRILSLGPIQQAVALAALAQNLKAPAAPKTVTSAPAPVTPKVGGGRTSTTPNLEDNDLPIADWIKLREKNLPKRASR